VNTAWALGLIVGPALGGYLSQVPVQKEKKRKEKKRKEKKRKEKKRKEKKNISFSYCSILFFTAN
jgi:dihydroxyacetone kinase-like predicted kinase